MITLMLWAYDVDAGTDSGTAAAIFNKMDEVLQQNNISWSNCVGVSVDNTSVNLGKNNSVMTWVHQKHPAAYFVGCPYHVIHNTCLKASEQFCQVYTIYC